MNVHLFSIMNEYSLICGDAKLLKTQNMNTRSDSTINEIPEYLTIIDLKDVNCYLLKLDDGYILIDSGFSKNRAEVEEWIKRSGCEPGNLKLILLTHGDPDHTGNAAYLRKTFGSKIAMHRDDLGMVERGDLFWNRKINFFMKLLGKLLIRLLGLRLKKEDRFTPDIYLDDGQSLSEYGFDATVYSIPGHSKGSIGFLTAQGEFFCGDLLMNETIPTKTNLIADKEAFTQSVDRLRKLDIKMVYPGHGKPFLINEFFDNYP